MRQYDITIPQMRGQERLKTHEQKDLDMTATALTIIFIVLSALVAIFVRRVTRDRCLKNFAGNTVTLERVDGVTVAGKLDVENTGLEVVYLEPPGGVEAPAEGPIKTSYLLYKSEYPQIQALVRYHHQLSDKNQRRRERELKRIYHPGLVHRSRRKVKSIFKTLRDSVMEIINTVISQAQKRGPARAVMTSQDKYVTQMKTSLTGSIGASYEPLLERYIGHRVVTLVSRGDQTLEYCGILKEYTADFLEILDVDYASQPEQSPQKADLIVPRTCGIVRHLGE